MNNTILHELSLYKNVYLIKVMKQYISMWKAFSKV